MNEKNINRELLDTYFKNNFSNGLVQHDFVLSALNGNSTRKLDTLLSTKTPNCNVNIAVKYVHSDIDLSLKTIEDFILLLKEVGLKIGIIYSNLSFSIVFQRRIMSEYELQLKVIGENNIDEIKTFFEVFKIDGYDITIFPPNSWVTLNGLSKLNSNDLLCILYPSLFELHTAALVKQIIYFKFYSPLSKGFSSDIFLKEQENIILLEDKSTKVEYYCKYYGVNTVNYRRIVSNQNRFTEITGFLFSGNFFIQCSYILPLKYKKENIYLLDYLFSELKVQKES